MQEDLIRWKTDAWKNPDMVAWYHQRMLETGHTSALKNEVEVALCRRYAKGRDLLDVGIGTGRGSLPLAREGFRLTGVDSSQAMLDQCARLAGDLPVALRQGDLANLDFPDGCYDTIISLNVLVHFPHWRQVLLEWRRVVRPMGRIVFDIHSREHDLAAAEALGVSFPKEDAKPESYTSRIAGHELVEVADALNMSIVEVVPYAGVFAGGNVNHWLFSSLASGARFDRLLSWLISDERLFAFALFLEHEVFGVLTPKATGRMMVVLENRADQAGNAAWLDRCMALDEVLSRETLRLADIATLVPSWDAGWQARLNAHLDWPRNRVLLHFLLSNFLGRIDFASFLDDRHAEILAAWQQSYVYDLLASRSLRRFIDAPEFAEHLDYKGVNLRAGLEYELTREMLTQYFKAFPQT